MKGKYIWVYTVYWISSPDLFKGKLNCNTFSNKKSAIMYAKNKIKAQKLFCKSIKEKYNFIKPFIYRTYANYSSITKSDNSNVEFLTEKEYYKYVNAWKNCTTIIKY